MKYKIQYTDQEDRQAILDDNKDKILAEEDNITEGNFLIFEDIVLSSEPTIDEVLEGQQTIKDGMADMFILVASMQGTV